MKQHRILWGTMRRRPHVDAEAQVRGIAREVWLLGQRERVASRFFLGHVELDRGARLDRDGEAVVVAGALFGFRGNDESPRLLHWLLDHNPSVFRRTILDEVSSRLAV